MSRPLVSIPTSTVAGRTVPWLLATMNHKGSPTTWQKTLNGLEGPEGQYWSYDSSDNYDKSVWVIEGDTPVVPQNIFNTEVAGNIGHTAILNTTGLLQAVMTARYGLRLEGWNVHSGNNIVILGETPLDFLVAANINNFDWEAFRETSQGQFVTFPTNLKASLGSGRNYAVPKHGNAILSFRVVDKVQPDRNTPWINVKPEPEKFSLDSSEMFLRNEALVDEMKLIEGRSYWKLPKSLVRAAIRVVRKDFQYDTLNLNPNKIVEITWMPETLPDQAQENNQNFAVRSTTRDKSTVTVNVYGRTTTIDVFASRGGASVRYDGKDRCHIDLQHLATHPDTDWLTSSSPSKRGQQVKFKTLKLSYEVNGKAGVVTFKPNGTLNGKTFASLGIILLAPAKKSFAYDGGGTLIIPSALFRGYEEVHITSITADYDLFIIMAGH